MALTEQQIQELRKKYNLGQESEQVSVKPTAQERINKLRGTATAISTTPEMSAQERIAKLKGEQPKEEITTEPNYLQRVGGEYMKGAERVISGVKEGAEQMSSGLLAKPSISSVSNILKGAGTSALRTAGAVAGATFAPITEAPIIKQGLEKTGELIGKIPGVDLLSSKIQELSESNPKLVKNVRDVIDIASLGLGKTAEKPIQKALETGTKKALEKTSGLSAKTAVKAGGLLKSAGEKATGISIRMEEPTKIALQSYQASNPTLLGRIRNFVMKEKPSTLQAYKPITEAETATRRGLFGTEWQLGTQAKQVGSNLWKDYVAPALKSSKEKISMPQFLSDIKKEIMGMADLNRRKTLKTAFDKFAGDFKKVNNFSLEKLQEYKEGWAKFIPEASYKGKPIGGSLNEIRDMATKKARSIIYDKLGTEVKQAYLDLSNLKSIATYAQKSIEGLADKSFTRKMYEFLLDKTVTPISTTAGQILYMTGEGLEFIGKKGAKKVGDIIK